ncbi:MAG TPA: hemerythrin domain-containing protein [Rhodocyclaceae bacterium]|nr:hemerythrin domain-containing protein [Rhodocyclaceae bacterium]
MTLAFDGMMDRDRPVQEWMDGIATGHAKIDDQHLGMLQCFDEIRRWAADKRPLRLAYAISVLKELVIDHLATEDTLMRGCGYPDLEQHLKEHDLFRVRIIEVQKLAIEQRLTGEMVEELRGWLIHHFLHSDRQYAAYLNPAKERRPLGAPAVSAPAFRIAA